MILAWASPFKLSLCATFLIIVIILNDSRFIILISDADLQGQLLLFQIIF